MFVRRLLLLFTLFVFSHALYSQTLKMFPSDSQKFLEEMIKFIQESENSMFDKKAEKEFIEIFTLEWTSGKLNESHKKQIYKMSNFMLAKKMKFYPHFKMYLTDVMNIVKTKLDEKSFSAWHKGLDEILNSGSRGVVKKFEDYLEISATLFEDNSLYKSSTTQWRASNDNYYFTFDTTLKVIFPSLDLKCYAWKDSACIYKTKGFYYPTEKIFYGEGGKVNWKRAGLEENVVYAELGKYKIDVDRATYTADSVVFYNKRYFSQPLLGRLEEKVLANANEENASYPVFDSYDKRLRINRIFENIDYEGGFLVKGSKIIGSGDEKQDAFLTYYRGDQKFVVTGSKSYSIRKDRISSSRASITIYLDKDSIYHPGLNMKYLDEKKELSLLRGEEGIAKSPYFDSYHNLDLYVEALYWKLNEPYINLEMIKGIGEESKATFESSNYYTEQRYLQLQGIDEFNPLDIVRGYARKYKTDRFYLMDIASHMKIAPEQVKALLIHMANMGFLIYNLDNDEIIIKDRLYNYLDARSGRKDYDLLEFNSVISAMSNATINLINNELKLRGVASVLLSDSQNVYIYPTEQELTMMKNRDFIFSGRVHAGLFDFYGKEFSFTYNDFKLNLPNVDSLSFKVRGREKDKFGNYPLVRVKTVIEGISGDLLIDQSNNKSGFKPFHQYPIFNSKKESFAYYDKKYIYEEIYNREKFYFQVNPFTIDSLDNFTTDALEFKGHLVSAGIFPDIEQPLKVQPDYSLGFINETLETGYPAYGGKGTFYSKVNLSNKGLKGDGTLKYLFSTSVSDNFIFFPDSMNAMVQVYEVTEQKSEPQYPPIKTENVYVHWEPYKDRMIVSQKETPISMYNGEAKLHGSLVISPTGITGRGTIEFKDAEMDADLFKFKHHEFLSDTADFRLKAKDESGLAIKTTNYKAHIDFEQKKGVFEANGGASKVNFPVNQYFCYMDRFEWYMDKEEIQLASDDKNTKYKDMSLEELADVDLQGSEFVSEHPDQDSLRFKSPRAKYSLRNHVISAEEVLKIDVADVLIRPDKGEVTIHKKAEMETLQNAEILANKVDQYHKIYEATITIFGRNNYEASGKYDYKDETDSIQSIYFKKITVDTTHSTYGIGEIAKSANFTLSPNFGYAGDVKFIASKKFLNFNGVCNIKHDCDSTLSWIRFDADIDPMEIYIPISQELKDENNEPVVAAILIANDTNDVYAAFLKKKKSISDLEIISANGFLMFDKITDEYRISNMDKLKDLSRPGNYLSLGKSECIVYGDGKLALGAKLGQVSMQIYGNVKYEMIPDTTVFNLVMASDFFFNDNVLEMMSKKIETYSTLRAVNLTSVLYTKVLTEILGTETADKLIAEVSLYGAFKKMPQELRHTLFLADVNMIWNPATKSYISVGGIGIGSIDKTQINKYVNGQIEVIRKRSGDEITIYLEPDEYGWYFFNYKRGIMYAFSSDPAFNTIINDMKPDDRKSKTKEGNDAPYSYMLGTEKSKREFLKKFQPPDTE